MSGKSNKKIRKLAAQLATQGKSYLVKKTTKVFTDLQGNHFPYTTDQTVAHPNSAKSIVKFLNKFNMEGITIFSKIIPDIVKLETTARLSELAKDGYTLVK